MGTGAQTLDSVPGSRGGAPRSSIK